MAASAEEGKPHGHGVVLIVLPDNSPSSSFEGEEEAVTFLDRGDGGAESREEKQCATFSLRRAAAVLLALAAVAVAGYLCLNSGADWPFLEQAGRGAQQGASASSFLLPLHAKPRNSTARSNNAFFQDRQYYTTVSIGNPPRPYYLDVDTGSDLTWVQCDAPCSSCAKGAHPLYKPARENIVPRADPSCQQGVEEEAGDPSDGDDASRPCDYDILFADQSSSLGVLARDAIRLDGEDERGRTNLGELVFGCSYDQRGGDLLASLENTVDGVLGLSGAPVSLPTQLASQGTIGTNVFGHCIAAADHGAGGYLFLGDGYVPALGMTWVPIRTGPGNAYSAQVRKLTHGDRQLGDGGKPTRVIFDSGSAYTYFPHQAYLDLTAALKDVFLQDDSDEILPFCMKAEFPVRSVDDVKHLFKPLTLQFGNRFFVFPRTFTVHPEDYLIINDKGNICLGVLDGTEIGYGSAIVLGDASLRGKLIAYDNDENRIGWSSSDCVKPHKQSITPLFLRRALPKLLL